MRFKHGMLALSCVILAVNPSLLSAQAYRGQTGERPRIRQGSLTEGAMAPDFSLYDVTGTNTVKLSELKGKPVVLIFGSCTCPPFVATTPSTEQLFTEYKDRVAFYIIYIREAHPTDGRTVPNNRFQVKSPKSLEDRQRIAANFTRELKVSIPVLVDAIDDKVENAYSCWPNRMFIIDAQGQIADSGSAGPGGVRTSMNRARKVLNELLADKK